MIAIRTTSPTLWAGGGRVRTVKLASWMRAWLASVWFNEDVDLNRVND
jgi:hypothetical protein